MDWVQTALPLSFSFLQGDELAKLVPVHEDFLVIALGSPDRGDSLEALDIWGCCWAHWDHTFWSFAVRSIQLFGTQFDPFPFNAFPGFGVAGFSLASNFGVSYAWSWWRLQLFFGLFFASTLRVKSSFEFVIAYKLCRFILCHFVTFSARHPMLLCVFQSFHFTSYPLVPFDHLAFRSPSTWFWCS